jgi:hypothetical protein
MSTDSGPERLQIGLVQRHQAELAVNLCRASKMLFGPVDLSHLRLIAGEVKSNEPVLWMPNARGSAAAELTAQRG